MSASVQFVQTTPQELQKLISDNVEKQLNDFLKHFTPNKPKEYLTRQDVAKMFSVDISTIHNWTKSKKLKPLSIGSRIYFLRSDIEASLIPLHD